MKHNFPVLRHALIAVVLAGSSPAIAQGSDGDTFSSAQGVVEYLVSAAQAQSLTPIPDAQLDELMEMYHAELPPFRATVDYVNDGDTFRATVIESCGVSKCPAVGSDVRVRLAEIDAPESDQPWGDASGDFLDELVNGKTVQVWQTDKDQYGRIVGQVTHDELWVNGIMVGEGHAWVWPRYAETDRLFTWQEEAQLQHIGLWSQPSPMPPWEWRHQ